MALSATVIAPAATGASPALILDQFLGPQNVGLAIELTAGASLTTKVQWTLDNPYSSNGAGENSTAIWFDDKNLTALVANTAGIPVCAAGFSIPVRAVRLNNTVYASGTATLTAVQAGGVR